MSQIATGNRPKVYLGTRIPPDLKERLEARAQEEDRSVSQLVDRAVRAYLDAAAFKLSSNELDLKSPTD